MATLSIRIDIEPSGRIGPGKIELLETIARTGSISAAGRALDMSYRRAWDLVSDLGRVFGQPVVSSQTGGKRGGGAKLTPFGEELVAKYREIERLSAAAAEPLLAALQSQVSAASADRAALESSSG